MVTFRNSIIYILKRAEESKTKNGETGEENWGKRKVKKKKRKKKREQRKIRDGWKVSNLCSDGGGGALCKRWERSATVQRKWRGEKQKEFSKKMRENFAVGSIEWIVGQKERKKERKK